MDGLSREQQDIIRNIEERIAELKEVKQLLLKCRKDYECAAMERDSLRKQNDRLLHMIKECCTELCKKCGKTPQLCCYCKWNGIDEWNVD